jgi:hypothetical protein
MQNRVAMRESIEITRSAEDVFAFVSIGTTDPQWRTEVDRMEVNGPPALGTQWEEYSTFFKFLHTMTPVSVVELQAPKRVVVQTPAQHPSWLRSVREVESLTPRSSRFTYELAFDLKAFKQMSPVVPPRSLVTWWYGKRIRKYLRNAKQILEAHP